MDNGHHLSVRQPIMIPGRLSSSSGDDVLVNALNFSSALSGFSSMGGGGGGGFVDLTVSHLSL
jgi:hypothetical protein